MTLSDEVRCVLDGRWAAAKARARTQLAGPEFGYQPFLSLAQARDRTLHQLRLLVDTGHPAAGFPADHGGGGDLGRGITFFEMLARYDLSLMVKAGVQWGLFGGAIESLGTKAHHDSYIKPLIDLELLGCFAMTETGHGSDVQSLQTTASYDPATAEFVIHTPTPQARKDYIGGAARDARVAVVFAQLITPDCEPGGSHGVHALVVPIRDQAGAALPGITLTDCGAKAGLAGVDNGRIVFDHVRVAREALLNRYAEVDLDGSYSSEIASPSRRFFTMLGTLVRGRAAVAGAAGAATQVALSIAVRYALQRVQFRDAAGNEVVIMDYRTHQRRLLPLIARSYAFQFAQNELVAALHDRSNVEQPDPHQARELESRAAGIKALTTWHATRAIQECREACGGAGYLAENRISTLKADTDVFTTFEGDNTVLIQLVAKELLTAHAGEVSGLDFLGMIKFVARTATEIVVERTAAQQLIQRLIDAAPIRDGEFDLLDRGSQLRLFEDRERHLLETLARRLRRSAGSGADEFTTLNAVQDHLVAAGRAHMERVVLEAFLAGIDRCADDEAKRLLEQVCDLYALSMIQSDKAWFLEHNRLSPGRAKAVTTAINDLCAELRPYALELVEGFGVPEESLGAAMLK